MPLQEVDGSSPLPIPDRGTGLSSEEELLTDLSTDHLEENLRERSVRGGVITLTSQGTLFVLQSVFTVTLARILTPSDFGLVAMVTSITGLATAFADMGLSEATIQRKEITHDQVAALFWINVAIGCGLTAVTAALAPVLALFYREPKLVPITLTLSLTFLIGGLRVQADALLKRQMRFSSLAIRDITSWLIALPVCILMALNDFGYWALVAFPLTVNFVQMLLSWLMIRWRPTLPRRGTKVRSMITFGGNVAASYLIFNLNRSADAVLIGWYWGASPLGLYSRAYNLPMLPVRQLNAPISSVAIPTFSRIQNDPERFARSYLRLTQLMIWVAAPLFGYLFVCAEPIIVLLLGVKWREAAPVFQILAASALGQLLLESIVWLLVSRGQSARLFRVLITISPVIVVGFAIGLPFGIKGVALSASLVLLGLLPLVLSFAFHGTDLTLRRLAQALFLPLMMCLTAICTAELTLRLINPQIPIHKLLVAVAAFLFVYLISVSVPLVRRDLMSFVSLVRELRPWAKN